ncbi:hypothetical protein A3Q56_06573 [Intoshia linei]|uniref:Uncharacterized protein n=1 Tax=Intoshia linei TaxID=1819745 RepID=A0A177AW29_9BILA|nr:hypothetical protein A3Q56_06573 [Intoshia linei]
MIKFKIPSKPEIDVRMTLGSQAKKIKDMIDDDLNLLRKMKQSENSRSLKGFNNSINNSAVGTAAHNLRSTASGCHIFGLICLN